MFAEFNPAKRLDSVVDLKIVPGFADRFKAAVVNADPFVIYTHEAQADGAAAAVVTEYLVRLAGETNRVPRLRGFVMGAARSMVDGQQGRKLQVAYHVFNLLFSARGLKVYPFTREEDVAQYRMSRDNLLSELRPMVKKMKQGYPPAILATGSVEGGRHDRGCDPEDIHGLQRLTDDDILTMARKLKKVNGDREIVLILVGLHGGFRLQSPNRDKRYVTKEGLATFLGLPERFIPHTKMEASVGTIIGGNQMVDRFGRDWMKADKDKDEVRRKQRVQEINDFIMGHAALLIPPHARGAYSHAIELLTPS